MYAVTLVSSVVVSTSLLSLRIRNLEGLLISFVVREKETETENK